VAFNIGKNKKQIQDAKVHSQNDILSLEKNTDTFEV
jgi:hypothetical protein